jgi:hypothetical protein
MRGVMLLIVEQFTKISDDNGDETLGPYSYLERDSYTTEIYKVELHNFPPRVGIGVCLNLVYYLWN